MAQQDNKFLPLLSNINYTKIIENCGAAPIDVSSLIETQRKNIQALSQAQQMAFGNIQAIARRQVEVISKFMEDQSKLTTELLREGKPEDKITKNAEIIKKSYENAMANAAEIAEMVKKANTETTGILNKRASATIKEIRCALDSNKKTG